MVDGTTKREAVPVTGETPRGSGLPGRVDGAAMEVGPAARKPRRLSHSPTKAPGAPALAGKGTVEAATVTVKMG